MLCAMLTVFGVAMFALGCEARKFNTSAHIFRTSQQVNSQARGGG